MKYVIPLALLLYSLLMSAIAVYCVYLTFSTSWIWLFVAIGFAYTAVVGFLATSAGFSAVRDW